MYETYFGLREKPFDVVPNPAYLYLSRTHKQAMTYMRYGLQEGLGFVLMTGGVGTGKTTLVRELIRSLGPEITFARVFNTRVTSEELIAMINEDFGLETSGKGKIQLMKDLYAHLIREYSEGRRPVLIIDEAQNLSLDQLEEVRMLSNFETDDAKLLQILLVGQIELERVLSLDEMQQFRQRIAIACRIENLTRQEVEEYILHRLEVAGNRTALAFADDAFDAIHEVTGGVPRQINTLCDFLLLTAFTEERKDITADLVRDTAAGLGLTMHVDQKSVVQSVTDTSAEAGAVTSTGKRVLLEALGVMLRNDGNNGHASLEGKSIREYPVAVRSISHRLQHIEKEIAHLEKEEYVALKRRIDSLEERIMRKSHNQQPNLNNGENQENTM